MQLKKYILAITCILLFALPWQTRLIYQKAQIGGVFYEYGSASLYGSELLLGVILVLVLWQFFRSHELRAKLGSRVYFHTRKKALASVALLFIFFALQLYFSVSPRISYDWATHLLEAVCLAFVLLLQSEYRLSFVMSFWLGGVVQALLALQQFITQHIEANKFLGLAEHSARQLGDFVIEVGSGPTAERWLRAYGSFGSPNILGGFLALCWLLGIILYVELIKQEKYKYALWVTVGNLFVLVGLILSFSRSAWVGALAGAAMLALVGAKSHRPLRDGLIKQLFFSLAIVLIFFLALRPLFLVRASGEGRLETKSIADRTTQYSQAVRIIQQRPLWGVGPGAYTLALHEQNPQLDAWSVQPVHNVFMLALAEMGIIGFAMVLALFYFCGILLWKVKSLYFSILISIFVIALFDHYFFSLYSGLILCGAAMGLSLTYAPKNQPE